MTDAAFEALDTNVDGMVSRAELSAAMQYVGRSIEQNSRNSPNNNNSEGGVPFRHTSPRLGQRNQEAVAVEAQRERELREQERRYKELRERELRDLERREEEMRQRRQREEKLRELEMRELAVREKELLAQLLD